MSLKVKNYFIREQKSFITYSVISVILIALSFAVNELQINKIFSLIYLPFNYLGQFLRWLSLKSTFLNVISIILYIIVSLMPIIFYIITIVRHKKLDKFKIVSGAFALIITVYLFYMLFYFVNPKLLLTGNKFFSAFSSLPNADFFYEMIKIGMSFIFYLLCLIVVFRYCFNKIKESSEKIYDYAVYAFEVIIICCLIIVFYLNVISLIINIRGIDKNTYDYYYSLNIWIAIIQYFLRSITPILMIFTLKKFQKILRKFEKNIYDRENIHELKNLTDLCKTVIFINIFSVIIDNFVTLILRSYLINFNFYFTLPIIIVAISVIIIIISKIIAHSIEMYEENQLTI